MYTGLDKALCRILPSQEPGPSHTTNTRQRPDFPKMVLAQTPNPSEQDILHGTQRLSTGALTLSGWEKRYRRGPRCRSVFPQSPTSREFRSICASSVGIRRQQYVVSCCISASSWYSCAGVPSTAACAASGYRRLSDHCRRRFARSTVCDIGGSVRRFMSFLVETGRTTVDL